jgi:hypothetical protein
MNYEDTLSAILSITLTLAVFQNHILSSAPRSTCIITSLFLKKKPLDVFVNINCTSFCTCMIMIDVISNLNTSFLYVLQWREVRMWNAATGHEQPRGSCSCGANVNQYNIHVTYSPFSRQFY